MTAEAGFKAAKVLGPKTGKIAVVAITAASVGTDMTATTQLGQEVTGKIVAMISDVNVFYRWGSSGETIDETDEAAAGGEGRCFLLPANSVKHEYAMGTHLYLKGASGATGRIRVAIASD